MIIDIVKGISVPFLGTTLGAFCVFFLKNELSKGMQKALTGFAAGVMVAASVWSFLIPAIELSAAQVLLLYPCFGLLSYFSFSVQVLNHP